MMKPLKILVGQSGNISCCSFFNAITIYQFYDVNVLCLCDVTPSVYPHRAGLKNMPGHGGIRTYDLWILAQSHKHLIHLSTLHQHSKCQCTNSLSSAEKDQIAYGS